MAARDSDTEYREYNLRSGTMRTDVWHSSSELARITASEIEHETNDVAADARKHEFAH